VRSLENVCHTWAP